MKTRTVTDTWIFRIVLALGVLAVISAIFTITLAIMGRPVPELLLALGVVAVAGLARLLISPLNRSLYD